MYKKNQGVTLIELMVVVAIIAVLMAIAMPMYQQTVIRNNRVAVQAEMMKASGLLERYKARQLTYTGANFTGLGMSTTATTTLDFPYTGTPNYTLVLTFPAINTWLLKATPINRQATANDGALALDSVGRQCWSYNNNAGCSTDANLSDPALAWSTTR